MKNKKNEQMTIPIFIPHLGCKNDCTFCNQRAISGVKETPILSETYLVGLIESYLSESRQKHIEIGFFGGSFTGLDVEYQEVCLQVAATYLKKGAIQGIRLSTRPDYINKAVIERLLRYGVTTVELGVQSFEESVLRLSQRGHDVNAIYHSIRLLKMADINVGIQLMLGLLGDTEQSFLESVEKAIALKPSCMRLYPTLVIKQTELYKQYLRGEYSPLSLEEAVRWSANAYERLLRENIPVIRMGLQASDSLSGEDGFVAGPHHDAFRSLVESELYRRLMERDLASGRLNSQMCVKVNSKHVSFFSGHLKSNLKWLASHGIHIERIEGDMEIAPYTIKWY